MSGLICCEAFFMMFCPLLMISFRYKSTIIVSTVDELNASLPTQNISALE